MTRADVIESFSAAVAVVRAEARGLKDTTQLILPLTQVFMQLKEQELVAAAARQAATPVSEPIDAEVVSNVVDFPDKS